MKPKCFSILILLLPLFLFSQEQFPVLKGWEVLSETEVYDTDNLWEYINGAAEQFYDYGFEELKAAEFKSKKISASVDIYNMGTSLNAFGIYMTERSRKGNYLDIGTEAVVTPPSQGLLLKDKYYVKINFFDGKLTEKLGIALLKQIEKGLPGENSKPQEIDLLPEENRVAGSIFYSKKGYQGLSELKNCLAAKYEIDEKKYQYFVVIPESEKDGAEIEDALIAKWKKTEKDGHYVLYRKIPYKGYIGIFLGPEGMLGVTDCPDKGTMLERLFLVHGEE